MEWNGIWVYGGLINMLLWLYGESLFWGGGGGSGGWKIINREGRGGSHPSRPPHFVVDGYTIRTLRR
jgi:hypothetical protein